MNRITFVYNKEIRCVENPKLEWRKHHFTTEKPVDCWCISGFCLSRRAFRTFRIDSIENIDAEGKIK